MAGHAESGAAESCLLHGFASVLAPPASSAGPSPSRGGRTDGSLHTRRRLLGPLAGLPTLPTLTHLKSLGKWAATGFPVLPLHSRHAEVFARSSPRASGTVTMQDGGSRTQMTHFQAVPSSSASERELGEGSGQRSQKVPEVAASLWKCRATLGLSNASVALKAGLCLRDRQSRPKRDGPQTQRTGGEGKRAGGGRRRLLSSSPVPRTQALQPKKERERDPMPKQGPVTRSLLHAAARPSGRNLECERTLSPEARRLRPRQNLEPTEVVSPDTADGGP